MHVSFPLSNVTNIFLERTVFSSTSQDLLSTCITERSVVHTNRFVDLVVLNEPHVTMIGSDSSTRSGLTQFKNEFEV